MVPCSAACALAIAAAAFAVVVLLCGLSNNYYLLYMPLLFGLALPWLLPRAPAGLRLRALGLLAAFVLPLALAFVPLALRYTDAAARYGFTRELPMGVGLEKYLATRPENWLYGETVAGVRLQTQAAHFTGFLPLGLAALAWLWLPVLAWLFAGVAGAHLVLGPYLAAEHTGMPTTGDVLARTRSIRSNVLVRWLLWNMPYHAEHHGWPAVPFHALPALHARVAARLPARARGYLHVYADALLRRLARRA